MIEVKSISMRFGKTLALNKISFCVEEGKILGLLGPNGAGKTTLMRILTTYLYPYEGTAIIEGYDITNQPLSVRKLIGYMPESLPLYDDMLVDEYLIFIARARELSGKYLNERLQWVKNICGITEVWKHPISEISRGFRQRVGLAQALIHDPKVLILDEPTTGLDPLQIINIRKLIRNLSKNKIVIFSTHILQEVEALADRIVILNNGFIIADGKRKEITQMTAKDSGKIILAVKAPKEKVESILQNTEGIEKIHFLGSPEEGYVRFLISGEPGESTYPILKEIIEKQGWIAKQPEHEEATLEEAFICLLKKTAKKPNVERN